MFKKKYAWVFIFSLFLVPSLQAEYRVLHSFAGGASDGDRPFGSLIVSGFTLYGMTEWGGASDRGTIFKMNTDGTGFKLLHAFSGGGDGAHPEGSLILSGPTLYGMTTFGGASDGGTIFKVQTDGTGFMLLHSFDKDEEDGGWPVGSLILNDSTLYGTTFAGGASSLGTIFTVNTDGTGYAVLHSFADAPLDGSMPRGSLILSGSTLYGMTVRGGASDNGTIFKINPDGTGFALVHSFAGGASDGSWPEGGSLILSGSAFYGMTCLGGANDTGTLFKINPDGTGFVLVHSFAGAPGDGAEPNDSVIFISSAMHGMTIGGGVHGLGAVFKVNADGTGFALLHSFAGGTADGWLPWGSLINGGQTLYGMTSRGGASDKGIIFCLFESKADIALTESVDNLAPLQGSEINLTITAKNYGPNTATGLKATDQLLGPPGLRYLSSSPSQGAYDVRSGVWDIGSLAKNAAATLTLKVRAVKSGNTSNSASLGALNEYDPIISNNSATVTINVTPALPDAGVIRTQTKR